MHPYIFVTKNDFPPTHFSFLRLRMIVWISSFARQILPLIPGVESKYETVQSTYSISKRDSLLTTMTVIAWNWHLFHSEKLTVHPNHPTQTTLPEKTSSRPAEIEN